MMTSYIEDGKHSLSVEIRGLESILNNSINNTFDKVVKTLLNTKGRVILSGVGKPGYLARRVSATFSSTGTPSLFVHADEASHGDLGMITKDDTVILLSNSGSTKELNDIISDLSDEIYVLRFDIKLIGITRNSKSFLAEAADIAVVLENIEQTNIVDSPTTSEIMILAYLDAVATALIKAKHFNKDKFKIFHPGGKLGSTLLKVEEIMHKGDELPLVHENDSMEKIINTMIEKPLGCVGILDNNDNLIGIITDGDFKRKIIQYGDLMNKKITEIMTPNPITINKDSFALDAVKIMKNGVGADNNYIQVLLVTEDNNNSKKVIGLIHIQDCLRAGVI